MTAQSKSSTDVALAEPEHRVLCSPLFFALMLSSLRRAFPRVHYAFPQFATFCRGEPLHNEALEQIQQEIDEIIQGMKRLTTADNFELAPGEDEDDPEIYRQAHYRGRTFDRTRIRVAVEERSREPAELYEVLLCAIQQAAQTALAQEKPLCQTPRSYHRPLGPMGY